MIPRNYYFEMLCSNESASFFVILLFFICTFFLFTCIETAVDDSWKIYISLWYSYLLYTKTHTHCTTHIVHTHTNKLDLQQGFFVNFVKENNTGMSFAKENMIFLHDHLILSCYILLYLIGLSIQGLYLLLSFTRPYIILYFY